MPETSDAVSEAAARILTYVRPRYRPDLGYDDLPAPLADAARVAEAWQAREAAVAGLVAAVTMYLAALAQGIVHSSGPASMYKGELAMRTALAAVTEAK